MTDVELAGYRADHGLTYAQIERRAMDLRSIVFPGMPRSERLDGPELFDLIEEHTVSVGETTIALEAAVKDIPPRGPEAFTRYHNQKKLIVLTLSVKTYKGLLRGYPRDRFTLCHEVGHVSLHAAWMKRSTFIQHDGVALNRGKKSDHLRCEDTEWQANAFAGALLMPAEGLADLERIWGASLNATIISQTFQVSLAAAARRLSIFNERRTALLAA